MTEQLNIQISAFVDDELREEECELLVRRLCADDAMRETVSRYALIGDVLRGDNLGVRHSLSHKIRSELHGTAEFPVSEEITDQIKTPSSWQRFIKPVSGLAVAATVAAVAVLSLQSGKLDDSPFPADTVAAIDDGTGSSQLNPVDIPVFFQDVRPVSVMPESRMDQYLMRHRNYASGLGGQTIVRMRDVGSHTLIPVTEAPEPENTGAEEGQ